MGWKKGKVKMREGRVPIICLPGVALRSLNAIPRGQPQEEIQAASKCTF